MVDRWIKRRAHTRFLGTGRAVPVATAWVRISTCDEGKPQRSFRRRCPMCGSDVLSVRMPRGGWGHFNGNEGLSRMKHPCMYLGQGLGRRRGDGMDDLFDAALQG
jgi:hypothetical protein